MISFIPITIGIALSVYFIIKRGPNVTLKDVLRKELASICFVITGLINHCIHNNTFTVLMLCGLIASMLGDVALDYQYCCKEKDSQKYLLTGFATFAIGHFCYVLALSLNNIKWYYALITVLVAMITSTGVALTENLMRMNYGSVKSVVIVYSGIVTCPLTVSVLNTIQNPTPINALYSIAFLMFLLSDLVLSGIYFGNKNNKKNIATCHILYYLAQYLIVFTSALNYTLTK